MGIYKPKTSRHWWAHFQYQGQRQFLDLGITFLGKASDRKLAEEAYHKKRSEFIQSVETGIDVNIRWTLGAVVEEYLRLHATPNKRSVKNDETILNRIMAYFGKDTLAKRVTPNSLEKYRSDRMVEVSQARINRELATLKSVFSKAVLWGRLVDNPVKRIKMFREDSGRERFLTAQEKDALLKAAPEWMRPILILALNTGMRQGEILDLKWADVNLDQNVLLVAHSKSGKPRHIPINSNLTDILKRHPKRGPWVFCDEEGRKFSRHGTFRTIFEQVRLKLLRQGVPAFVFHDLRHTFGSDLAMRGADIKAISELLGHSTLRMSERYMHLSPNHKRVTVELLVSTKNASECEYSVNEGGAVNPVAAPLSDGK